MYRSYQDVKRLLEERNIAFTGNAQLNYRKSASAFASRARFWSEPRLKRELSYLVRLRTKRIRRQVERVRTTTKTHDIVSKAKWRQFAQKQNFPDSILNLAYGINQQEGFDMNAHYGWAVAYYHFVYGLSIDMILEVTDVDMTEPNLYVTHLDRLGLV